MPSSSDYLLVPGGVESSKATVWVGSTDVAARTASVIIEHRPSGTAWPVADWQQWPTQDRSQLAYARVTLDGLSPGTQYPLALRVNRTIRAVADVTTLPTALPPITAPPFTILLGSCFCESQDDSGRVGRAFAQLPGGAKPHLKLLVGDQVYLDSPWYRFTLPHSASRLGAAFLNQYLKTWRQGADQQGFNLLLRSGANYFCADDHEFWNNAPFPCSFAVNTWTQGGRHTWATLAKTLYEIFQTGQSLTAIDVGAFSIRVLDTRVNRQPDRSAFISAEDMRQLEQWVTGLTGPGLLVLGQPLFATRAGFKGRFADWNLPDFDQYAELCRILLASRQSIVVVTGDVHYGRIARAPLPSGAEIVEVISSPMALVDHSAGGSWKKAPDLFPAEAIPGIKGVRVTTTAKWELFANHFVTLDFNSDGGGVRCRVRTWETEPRDGVSANALVAEFILKQGA